MPCRPRAQGPWLGPPRCGQRPLGRQLRWHCFPPGQGVCVGGKWWPAGPSRGCPPSHPPARPALGPLAGALRPPPQPTEGGSWLCLSLKPRGPCGSCFLRPGELAAGWPPVSVPVEAGPAACPRPPSLQNCLDGLGGGNPVWGGPLVWDLALPFWLGGLVPLHLCAPPGKQSSRDPQHCAGWRGGIWGWSETPGHPQGLGSPLLRGTRK